MTWTSILIGTAQSQKRAMQTTSYHYNGAHHPHVDPMVVEIKDESSDMVASDQAQAQVVEPDLTTQLPYYTSKRFQQQLASPSISNCIAPPLPLP